MSISCISDVLPRHVELRLTTILSEESFVEYPPEMSLMAPNCGIASHVVALYAEAVNNRRLVPYIGKIESMTFADSFRPFRHVLLQEESEGGVTIIDPTAMQFIGNAGLTTFDHMFFEKPPSEIVGEARIYEVPNTQASINNFVKFIYLAIEKAREEAELIRDRLSQPRDGSQAFLSMSPEEIKKRLMGVWDMNNYTPDPLESRKPFFIENVHRIVEILISLDDEPDIKVGYLHN